MFRIGQKKLSSPWAIFHFEMSNFDNYSTYFIAAMHFCQHYNTMISFNNPFFFTWCTKWIEFIVLMGHTSILPNSVVFLAAACVSSSFEVKLHRGHQCKTHCWPHWWPNFHPILHTFRFDWKVKKNHLWGYFVTFEKHYILLK